MSRATVAVTCPRCGGTGRIPRFGHYAKGVCFQCYGAKVVQMKAAPDGTADHDHRLGGFYPNFTDDCVLCGLPVSEWPPVVPAHWYGEFYDVFVPTGQLRNAHEVVRVPGETRAKAQAAVRKLVADRLPKFRIKWINRAPAVPA